MNGWILALILILWVLWTVLVLAAGYFFGWENHKKEVANQEPIQLPQTYNFTQLTKQPELTEDEVDRIARTVLANIERPEPGQDGLPGPSFLQEHLEKQNMTGAEWIDSVEERLVRIGRRAGMSI